MKCKVYIGRWQLYSKEKNWNAILDAVQSISYEAIQQIIKTMDEGFVKLVSKHEAEIIMSLLSVHFYISTRSIPDIEYFYP